MLIVTILIIVTVAQSNEGNNPTLTMWVMDMVMVMIMLMVVRGGSHILVHDHQNNFYDNHHCVYIGIYAYIH